MSGINNPNDNGPGPVYRTPCGDGSITGIRGGVTHNHDYNDVGIGHVKDQRSNEIIGNYNNFNDKIDSLLPPWMKK
ncbi:hypothetical protein ISS06_00905 [Patescibacteria group bacterium]|nr:hypothetical protein [Patescibacteria group bacterium]